jgi:hypothetical protein
MLVNEFIRELKAKKSNPVTQVAQNLEWEIA